MIGTKIEYIVEDFSGIKSVDEWMDFLDENPKVRCKDNFVPKKVKGVYILYDEDKKPIYIGKSKSCCRNRLLCHIRNKPNPYFIKTRLFELFKRKKYKHFAYIEVEEDFVNLLEVGLIRKFKPKFNIEFNSEFSYDEEWEEYLNSNEEYVRYKENNMLF